MDERYRHPYRVYPAKKRNKAILLEINVSFQEMDVVVLGRCKGCNSDELGALLLHYQNRSSFEGYFQGCS